MSDAPVAVVTGGNRGIGLETCRQLAALGHRVVLTSRDAGKGEAAARRLGGEVEAYELDVTSVTGAEALAEHLAARYGRLDALVNNAGINYDTWQRVSTADLAQVRETAETNLYGPWQLAQALLPLLRASRHGRIVNVSSGGGALASLGPSTPAYSITKLALNGLTLMLAADLRQDGILVNAVCPGWVATDMGGSGGRPVADGAAGVVWAATLPDGGPSGGFFRDRARIPW
ncbi:SDR family NAD(P)-dependent oxidoreductase [Kitasatospora sp. GAS204B]|uniref:SDR family NAD(P)-dependent oxidoreductase n=1 Tax=unclassified Kitasatospora TaxID=2633591 RepID=UPI00247420CA|nr:SDR family NAD(P)-dependent oxidoreductase [Kitasatospora sp. GAS204B]MDH6120162.1 NAD(P)-dependent dehydrogenase (short-subunit alcohol dehydrogenase family) [Kitasatospora sp. GAS204B]